MKCDSYWEICGAGPGMEYNSLSGRVVAGSKNRLWRAMTSKLAIKTRRKSETKNMSGNLNEL
jgi:hypothetical protein